MLRAMNCDARDAAARYYDLARRDMAADLEALAAAPRGVVLYMPELVALLKPARRDCPERWELLDDAPADADAWYIHLLVGDLALARRLAAGLPPLPWGCFRRGLRNRCPHCLPWRRLLPLPTQPHENRT